MILKNVPLYQVLGMYIVKRECQIRQILFTLLLEDHGKIFKIKIKILIPNHLHNLHKGTGIHLCHGNLKLNHILGIKGGKILMEYMLNINHIHLPIKNFHHNSFPRIIKYLKLKLKFKLKIKVKIQKSLYHSHKNQTNYPCNHFKIQIINLFTAWKGKFSNLCNNSTRSK